MLILYNILFIAGFILASPYFLYKLIRSDKWREGLRMRLGIYGSCVARKLLGQKTIWFHAASVGEVKAVLPLLNKIQERCPQFHIILTTVTRTGNLVARNSLGSRVSILYFPLDFYFSVARAIRVIHPVLVVLVESELWANFLFQLHRKKIPVALINVRMSMRSFRRYRRMNFFVRKFVNLLSLVTAPTIREATKMMLLGAYPKWVHVVGNLKYEKDESFEPTRPERSEFLNRLGIPSDALILLCGSTHPGEEEILVRIYQELLKEFPHLYLILVPRHPERAPQVARLLSERGLSFQLRTQQGSLNSHQVLILDTVGELESAYSMGDVVFIGKSLTCRGGQNFLEPARFGKPIVFGPHMENFEDMANSFVEGGGAVQVKDPASLKQVLGHLLGKSAERERIGQRAKEILALNQGAVEKTLELIAKLL